jgi:hypothetical protein
VNKVHTREEKLKYKKYPDYVLIDIILDRDKEIDILKHKLEQIRNYFDDLDEIYIKDVKDEINRIMEVI